MNCSRTIIWILFFMICQANGCLDLLVRSFNEVFSPIIETGGNRIEKPHNLDELTHYYKTDDYGNIVPNLEEISKLDEEPKWSNQYKRSGHWVSEEAPKNPDSETHKDQKGKHHNSGYVPGARPMVDVFFRFLDLFKLTGESEMIVAHPRHYKENRRMARHIYYNNR